MITRTQFSEYTGVDVPSATHKTSVWHELICAIGVPALHQGRHLPKITITQISDSITEFMHTIALSELLV